MASMNCSVTLAGYLASLSNSLNQTAESGLLENVTVSYDNGYEFIYQKRACADSWLLVPGIDLWPAPVQSFIYLLALLYSFLGIAIIADEFMAAIEVITSKKRMVQVTDKAGNKDFVHVQVWNPTVANLTLMALGSSAPEILLSVLETVQSLGTLPGELGPSTIVGSAAFNLLVITAVCVISIPNGGTRKVSEIGVFLTTAISSIFAYIWLLIILQVITPNVIDLWEAILTFAFFPLLVIWSYLQDKSWFKKRKAAHPKFDSVVSDMPETPDLEMHGIEEESDHRAYRKAISAEVDNIHLTKREMRSLMQHDFGDDADHVKAEEAASAIVRQLHGVRAASQLVYRVNARRGLTGSKRAAHIMSDFTVDSSSTKKVSKVQFEKGYYSVLENAGKVKVGVHRSGYIDGSAEVGYQTKDGTAKAPDDYEEVRGVLKFGPKEKVQYIEVPIVDDDEFEADENFFIFLTECRSTDESDVQIKLGHNNICTVTILDDDDPGMLSFDKRSYEVRETEGKADVTVVRSGGAGGAVTVDYETKDGTAVAGEDYKSVRGTLEFAPGETSKVISIPIINDNTEEPDETFSLILSNPGGGAQLSRLNIAVITIKDDDAVEEVAAKVKKYTDNLKNVVDLRSTSWAQKFEDAMTIGGDVDDSGKELRPSAMDFIMHFLSFGWKAVFALVPPTEIAGGWLAFFVALIFIGGLTAVVGELASLFGCSVGLPDAITAITFVALGTSLPDTFASRQAAKEAPDADAAVGNITGSNSVNVFLGLGLPWLIAAIYYTSQGCEFVVPAKGLAFSVLVFSGTAVICVVLLLVRRAAVGGELGGKTRGKWLTFIILIILWLVYIILSSVKITNENFLPGL